MSLTPQQKKTLRDVAHACDEWDGYAPHGASQWASIRALERRGLVAFSDWGVCADGCDRAGGCPHDVSIYTPTEDGQNVLDEEARHGR